ncbi:AMP-binding protein [Sulfitobacter donghicola]|uniref:AMP-dependent synthetase n=1 Tax=Sulfitobacter donghicola DSW-25 = KCTC 12864 = JCM 14565 TaxID=1300350 RepID=A0A073IMF0_9RHOB|nr:AMP-binding protein [Sulfitobacter donghicola]KEJ90924.1 AMP-dependent synthetase [Sulfitobacter donghicola DSW-25 = KCTC 12864 = JCM 14565]KIN68211.1 AMP-dependent synthetase and ligase [Sulfitobacter donghicola DSW-25 = KCTC 12864 = JCM 14565]
MSAQRFKWHPDARAFFTDLAFIPEKRTAQASIAAQPVSLALQGLADTLGSDTGFCLSDFANLDLSTLSSSQFATLTGGTSGQPKVIARTQESWIKSFHANAKLFKYSAKDSIAVLGSLSHSLALYGVLEGLHLGHDVHALSELSALQQSEHLLRHHCSILYATPTQLRLLPSSARLPDIRLILCGGGTLSDAVRHHVNTICPDADLLVFYGAAESSFITLSDHTTPFGSVGRAYPDVEIEIRDPQPDGTGTIWVRSPYLFDGYLRGNSPTTMENGGWITVGERGVLDENGNLFLRGRVSRMVKIADQSVFPDELETQFANIAGMPTCAVIPRPDVLRGHHLIAVMEGAENTALRDRLFDYCKAENLIVPRQVVFLASLPLLPSGKPDLPQIETLIGALE